MFIVEPWSYPVKYFFIHVILYLCAGNCHFKLCCCQPMIHPPSFQQEPVACYSLNWAYCQHMWSLNVSAWAFLEQGDII